MDLLILAPVLLFSFVAHEFAHAWVARREGDPTAYLQGRVTRIDPPVTCSGRAGRAILIARAGVPDRGRNPFRWWQPFRIEGATSGCRWRE
jgi:hypothetical protein